MKRIKIAFVIDTIDPHIGGTEKQLILLLNNINRDKYSPYLCCLKSSQWINEHQDICPVYILGIDSFLRPNNYSKLFAFSKFLKREKIDVVQTYFRDANIAGIIGAKLGKVKVIISSRRNLGYWHNKKEILLLGLLNPFVSAFVANSKKVAEYTIKTEKIKSNRIKVIYNGLDWNSFKLPTEKKRENIKDELGIAPDEYIAVAVANLRPIKGIDVILEAARLILRKHPGIKFLFVGEGDQRSVLEKAATEFGLKKNVFFLGTRDDVPDILAESDIGLLGSHSEGLSNSIIEYMAAGLPVVCTDVGGNPELVENGVNGYLVKANDPQQFAVAIGTMLDDPAIIKKMGKTSSERAMELFSTTHYVDKFEQLYGSLLAPGKNS